MPVVPMLVWLIMTYSGTVFITASMKNYLKGSGRMAKVGLRKLHCYTFLDPVFLH